MDAALTSSAVWRADGPGKLNVVLPRRPFEARADFQGGIPEVMAGNKLRAVSSAGEISSSLHSRADKVTLGLAW